jgi:uncharacterized membrane protein YdjX (TVP38/TMEM64 family)
VLNVRNNSLLRWMLVLALALAVPILPFLWFGDAAELRFIDWLDRSPSASIAAALVIGLLAVDILLPVPSSVVSTFAGKMLGFWGGTAASWCGMTVGAVLAFALVRILGRPLARRLSSEEELARMETLADRYGILILIVARPVPVFAEASVLMLGMMQLSWWRFLVAVALSNLGIAAAYAALGNRVQLPVALAASIAVPLLVSLLAKRFLPASATDTPRSEQ